MMRKRTYLGLMLVAGLVALAVGWHATASESGPQGFGKKLHGCYLVEATVGERTYPLMTTFTDDGGWVMADSLMFGYGDPETNGLLAPAHGTWIRTGRTEILLVGLGFVFDSADGAHTYTWKMRAPIEFDDEYQTAHSDFDAVMYLAEQDPLDPDEEPILEWTGFLTMRRINAE